MSCRLVQLCTVHSDRLQVKLSPAFTSIPPSLWRSESTPSEADASEVTPRGCARRNGGVCEPEKTEFDGVPQVLGGYYGLGVHNGLRVAAHDQVPSQPLRHSQGNSVS